MKNICVTNSRFKIVGVGATEVSVHQDMKSFIFKEELSIERSNEFEY